MGTATLTDMAGDTTRGSESGEAVGEALLGKVVREFATSRDFNGISANFLAADLNLSVRKLRKSLATLIAQGLVEIVHEQWFPNPHIRPFPAPATDVQLTAVNSSALNQYCVYPTALAMRGRRLPRRLAGRPYAARLWRGGAELVPIFFDMAVLERYRTDPRYAFNFDDTGGMISVRDEFYMSKEYPERDKILLQTFGVGFDEDDGRVVAVFLRYLADLSPEHQRLWEAFERTDRCFVHPDYMTAALGDFPNHGSIYRALLIEQVTINRMCDAIGRPDLFRVTFAEGRPDGYHVFFQPTERHFHAFVLELDKLLSQNIKVEFFENEVALTETIRRRTGEVRVVDRGSVALLEDWLRTWFRTSDQTAIPKVIEGLREVRRLRQRPAHAIGGDRYDKGYWVQQDALMERAYLALRTMRLILANFPGAEAVDVPDWVQEGRIRAR